MDERCDICGDIGVGDAIFTCDKCKISRQHLYCMRVLREEPPPYWCCETCELEETETSTAFVTTQGLPRTSTFKASDQGQVDPKQSADPGKFRKPLRKGFDWEKKVESGKTKYLPVQEVLNLPSGCKTPRSPVKFTFHSGPVSRKATSVKTPVKPSPPVKFSLLQNQVKHSGKSPVHALPVKKRIQRILPGNVLMNIAEGRKTERRVEKEIESQAPLASSAESRQTERRVEKEIVSLAPLAPSGCVPGTDVCTNLEPTTSDAEKVNRQSSPAIMDICYSKDASWKGSFKILNKPKYEGLCDGIRAHPSSRVRKKVYDLSRKMPELLQFELIPRGNLFQDSCPEKDDIGLFFFPCESERSVNYSSLLEFLGMEDLMMRMCIFDVELLVFASTLLHSDCQRRNGECFLWGLFRRVKGVGNREVVDMEIDMVGGEHVGRLDVPIPKEPVGKGLDDVSTASGGSLVSIVKQEPCIDIPPGFNKISKLGANDSPASAQHVRSSSMVEAGRNKSDRGAASSGLLLSVVKKEPWSDVPPGFENMSKLGVNGSPASPQSIRSSTLADMGRPAPGAWSKRDKRLLDALKSKDFPH